MGGRVCRLLVFFFKRLVEFTTEGLWLFFVCRLLIPDSISLLVIGLFTFSISS